MSILNYFQARKPTNQPNGKLLPNSNNDISNVISNISVTNKNNINDSEYSHINLDKPIDEYDDYFIEAGNLIIEKDKASIGLLQRVYKIGFNRAARIMVHLSDAEVVGPEEGTKPRKILMSKLQFEFFINNATKNIHESNIHEPKINDIAISREEFRIKAYNNKFDYMEGRDFEHYCADLLSKNDFNDIKVTQGSGDQGIDILAVKDNIKYGIQCKCYSSDIGNKAVQEAFSGKTFYDCHVGVVLTNRYFTSSAKELAHKSGVLLWDRDKLNQLVTAVINHEE